MSGEGHDAAPAGSGESPLAVIDKIAPDGWKGKLARATLQLIAGTERGAAMYGAMRERMDTVEGRSIVSNALAQAVANQAVNDPVVMERARARFMGDMLQKQENLEAVLAEAAVQLPQLPPPPSPSPINEAEPSGTEDSGGGEGDDESQPLDPDWAATFTDIAENATTDELRERLARVLAGELQAPGAFARGTLRAIAELERRDLEAMQAVMPLVLGGHLVRLSGSEELLNVGRLLPLADAGLILDANAMMTTNWGPPSNGENFLVHGSAWALLMRMKEGQRDGYEVIPLTRTGNAVADLLGRPDERPLLRQIVDRMNKDNYEAIVLGSLVPPNKIGAPVEQLFSVATQVAPAAFDQSVFGPLTMPSKAHEVP